MSGGAPPVHVEFVRFVREVLGCGCPDEVVARTVVDASDGGESGLDVGGRLLVRVLKPVDPDRLVEGFPEAVERLRAERDRRGFNRLRLVAVHPRTEDLAPVLTEMLSILAPGDNQIFVHAVAAEQLPTSLRHRLS